jgi:hypothetical protein
LEKEFVEETKIHILCPVTIRLIKLASWSTDLPERLTGPQLLKKFHAFFVTPRFITAFKTARHLSLP